MAGLQASINGFAGYVEVLEGPTGRRRWPDEVKARIVRESFESGSRVCEVARRHGVSPQQLTGWRRAAREGRLVLSLDDGAAGFVPLVIDDAPAADPAPGERSEGAEVLEIEVKDLVLRLPAHTAPGRVAALVAALRSSV